MIHKVLDVMALSEEVARDSQSGKLSKQLLAEGQTLYGINPDYPEYLERITPDGRRTLGQWRDGEFDAGFILLYKS
ncbi:hypothetical protein [Aliiglaciecola lipolytica]|uniref:hypothetical protein n=1 Tax=Aliiglaciecola lipolytica TaxID=477689 RepID=UPI001C097BC4|nr:hypothetical protein [Aliiglaciecola lipolytica]MBU2877080.1 hypothetical protein [Aliiglaciecola lipolytica]